LKVGNGEDCIPRNGRWNFNKVFPCYLFLFYSFKATLHPIRIERWEVHHSFLCSL
ncbi:Protein argonaute 16, partial [Camellia lanceoleosa]